MSKKKKIVVIIVVILVIAAILAGSIFAYLWHQRNNMTAEVQQVEYLNWGYMGGEMTSYGMVTNDYYQEVYLMEGQTVSEVYVTEGQEVKAGDPLLAYDMTLTGLQLEMQQLEVENIKNKLILAKRELEQLKKETPVPEYDPTREPMPETPETEEPEASDGQEIPEGGTEPETSGGYTEKELAEAIRNAEKNIRDLELQKRSAELQLQQMKNGATDGVVKATVDGIVKTVGDKENPPVDGSPFITVSGSEGLYVTGYLSELMLEEVQVGQIIYANSWESGRSFEATIQEISPYPSESSNSWGDGNPNVSYYPYTAYIADTEGLKNGEYVDLTMTATYSEDETAAFISLPKAYVRQENGRSYVLIADENDRLKKQYVETGRTFYGEAVEIKSGLSQEDRIAFPYGKTAKVGIKVKDMSDDGIMYY